MKPRAMDASYIRVRPARDDEGSALTALAVRAKSHWGYDEGFLESARANLTIDSETIRSSQVFVLERDGRVLGFHGLAGEPPRGRLAWLFLEPDAIGQGLGRLLWNDAIERARVAGLRELEIESDRFAEPFYLAMGAVRIGSAPSPVDGAELPLLEVQL
jgi:GNAT superfamily N-acetyltransferase